MNQEEVIRMALEALEWNYNTDLDNIPACEQWAKMLKKTITALRQAIEQAEQAQPVACIGTNGELMWLNKPKVIYSKPRPLYTAPVDGVTISEERVDETAERKHMTDLASVGEVGVWGEREWVSLTDQEVWEAIDNVLEGGGWLDVARALEAAIKRKNA